MYIYILYSPSLDQFYTGISRFRFKRQRQHRKGQSAWTARASDWTEIWITSTPDSITARQLERQIKARGAKRFLADLGVAAPPEAGQGSSLPR
ncbi:MAG: GIY-YIG nuclease family protein [Verrucomicrobia bacterium]|nr:GIY-YIG nuclease family protein [Verrucomicrobiota bacterium]MBU1909306.1 GIY-YIG nuclease family protein [Verrucomicrobiota bacterium]